MYATIVDGRVLALSSVPAETVDVPNGLPVVAGWSWTKDVFQAAPPSLPWRIKTLDTLYEIEAFEVVDSKDLPAGVNVRVIEETRTSVQTSGGWVDVQVGDWLVRCRPDASDDLRKALRIAPDECIRLAYDEATKRLG